MSAWCRNFQRRRTKKSNSRPAFGANASPGMTMRDLRVTNEKPYRPNVGIALFNAEGRVLIGHRFKGDGPEIILPGLDWQMPQGGIDEGEDLRAAAFRELWEEASVRSAEYLGETEWFTYEFPPYDCPQ